LKNGSCVYSDSNNKKPSDLGCGKWDWDNQKCLSCSNGWVFNGQGVCIPVSDQCKTSNTNGACLSCWKGYDLKNGSCVYSDSNNKKPSDLGCSKWDWDNSLCLECSKSWVFNNQGVCIPVSDQCKTSDSNGACLSCWKGYDLKKGSCVYSSSNNKKPSDLGCGKWDWDNQKCLSCSKNWYFNNDGECTPIDDLCSTFDSTGKCTSCFSGYSLLNGRCLIANSLCKTATI